MPTTFDVIYLGNPGVILDPTEGNRIVENGSSLNGFSSGTKANPLSNQIQEWALGSAKFYSGTDPIYNPDNNIANDTFTIDGGPAQTFDTLALYDAVITYSDGSTASVTAIVVQDSNGNLYLVPPSAASTAALAAYGAQPIDSIQLVAFTASSTGLNGNRPANVYQSSAAVCFAQGTRVRTPSGDVPVENLTCGDWVETLENGAQKIRWIGHRTITPSELISDPRLRPIRFAKGVLGNDRTVRLSRQHAVLIDGAVLARATHLTQFLKGVGVCRRNQPFSYTHFLFDKHQIVFAENMPVESLYPGKLTLRTLGREAFEKMSDLIAGSTGSEISAAAIANIYGDPARPYIRKNELRQRRAA